jgi:hypothetical protein
MTPALLALAVDPPVRACVIITDGDITYPPGEMPYAMLCTWMSCRATHAGSGWMLQSRTPLRSDH